MLGVVLYFAYGANLRRKAFTELCPGSEVLGVARLPDHRIIIADHGYATVVPSPGDLVWGLLWMVPAATLPALDAFEELDRGLYTRTSSRVLTPGGPAVEAMFYITPGAQPGMPVPGYLEQVLGGAYENELPASYLAALARLARA